jgi:hypothetical protein
VTVAAEVRDRGLFGDLPRSERMFANDPGWRESWWWLFIPIAVAIFTILSFRIAPGWHRQWVTPESMILESAQFLMMVIGFAIAVQLLFDPYVRKRTLLFVFTAFAALTCLYIGGEEVSWGQHIFYWDMSHLQSEVNTDGEFSLHNMNKAFERIPRALLQTGIIVGGILVPLVCAFDGARLKRSPIGLFLPPAALMPAALLTAFFKWGEPLAPYFGVPALAARASEGTEFFMYFFLMAYLIVFERRIRILSGEGA